MANTHYAVILFGGDFDNDHPDPALQGQGPGLELLAAGPEEFCWSAGERWTTEHPLRRDETFEVVARCPVLVRDTG